MLIRRNDALPGPGTPPRTWTPAESAGDSGRAAGRLLAAAATPGAGALALVSIGCSSLSKPDLEAALLALKKNAPIAELGLRRTTLMLDGEPHELVYAYAPSRSSDPARTPVVLVHGTPSTLFTWAALARGGAGFDSLDADRDVYLIEVVGHGVAPEGPRASEPTTFQVCADYVAAALDALELERALLVGQSYGGEFAWRAARDHPGRVAGLAIMSSSGYERAEGDWLPEEVEMRENGLADYGWLLNSRSRVERALAPHFQQIPPERTEEFFLVCENRSNWHAMIDLARDENGDREDDIAGISVPTLVLWGADDAGYDPVAYGERFARDIPDAEFRLVEGSGHYPQEERPAETARALAEFFRRVDAAEAAR